MAVLPIVEVSVLRPFQALLKREGTTAGPYLRQVGISPDQVAAGDGWITKPQAYAFMRAAGEGEGIPDLGYRVGRAFHFEALGSLGPRMQSCETLKEALDMLSDSVRRVATDNRVWLSRDDDHVWLHNDSGDTTLLGSEHGVQLGAMVFLKLVQQAARAGGWRPRDVRLESDPEIVHEMVPELAGARPSFRASSTAIRFPSGFLGRPLAGPAGNERRPALEFPPTGFGAALTEVVHSRLQFAGVPRIEEAAEMCAVSQRTLQRRLTEDGISYRRVCDRARFRRAVELLEDPSVTTSDLTAELGYSDRRSLIRAFRRFTGMTPGEYRRVAKD
ncbi:MAG: AraC family transcriptional regulator [marine benthic group bacterium]|nr:AraC family transcriptional regulator [Candidatus Carthagonibacter metallireducens]